MNYLVFDLETRESHPDVGWKNFAAQGISFGCAYLSGRDEFRLYGEDNLELLVRDMLAADLVVGFNIIDFDLPLLLATLQRINKAPGVSDWALIKGKVYDILADIQAALGTKYAKGWNLDNVARSNLPATKNGDGAFAPILWKESKIAELCTYVLQDVKVERDLFELARSRGYVKNTFVEPARLELVGAKRFMEATPTAPPSIGGLEGAMECREEEGGFSIAIGGREIFTASRGSHALDMPAGLTLTEAKSALFALGAKLLQVDERSQAAPSPGVPAPTAVTDAAMEFAKAWAAWHESEALTVDDEVFRKVDGLISALGLEMVEDDDGNINLEPLQVFPPPTGPNAEETATIITESLKDLGWDFKPAPTGQGEAALKFANAWAKWHDHSGLMLDDELIEASNGILESLGLELVEDDGVHRLEPLESAPAPVSERKAEDVERLKRVEAVPREWPGEALYLGKEILGFTELLAEYQSRHDDPRGNDECKCKLCKKYDQLNWSLFQPPTEHPEMRALEDARRAKELGLSRYSTALAPPSDDQAKESKVVDCPLCKHPLKSREGYYECLNKACEYPVGISTSSADRSGEGGKGGGG